MQRIFPHLKPSQWIPPLTALVLVAAWNAAQLRSISALERSGGILREQIAAALAVAEPAGTRQATDRAAATVPGAAKPLDWQSLAGSLAELRDGGSRTGMKAILELQNRLAGMSREEILAALDEIAGMELSKDARDLLEATLATRLATLDPEELLSRFVGKTGDDPGIAGGQLPEAMRAWAKRDLPAATAWLDGRIAAGGFESKTLEGRNDMRAWLEAALMESLLPADFQSAASRLAAIPEDQRREVLERLPFSDLTPEDREAYASLVREFVPQDERAGSFAHMASQLAGENGYENVTAFLDSVQATPLERAAAARQTAESQIHLMSLTGEVNGESVDRLRAWLDHQAPGQTDTITGKALAEAAQEDGKFGYGEASQLVLHYQQAGGGDDVLIAFLESYSARSNFEQAQHLVEMISDPQRRQQILRQLK